MAACVWNSGWQPTKTELDSYGTATVRVPFMEGKKNGLTAALELFVPPAMLRDRPPGDFENKTDAIKSLIFSYLEFCLWNAVDDSTNFQRNFLYR